jgi:adenosylcobinamide-GDP ribazoletransferase
MKRFLLAFQFLTIIPVKKMYNVSDGEAGSSSALFPLVGAFQGALLTFSSMLCMQVFPAELANGLLVLLMAIMTAGLHLDGLADTFDAIASRKDKEEKLAIMKDSAVGPCGVISIVLVILLKYLSFNALFFSASGVTYYSSLFLMPVFSRWAMVASIFHTKSARQEGLGKIFIDHTGTKELMSAALLTFMLSVVILIISNKVIGADLQSSFFVTAFAVLYIFCLIVVWFSKKIFGGMTGDTFGAVAELSEIIFLITVIICSQRST